MILAIVIYLLRGHLTHERLIQSGEVRAMTVIGSSGRSFRGNTNGSNQ
jgi:hypothetical protein